MVTGVGHKVDRHLDEFNPGNMSATTGENIFSYAQVRSFDGFKFLKSSDI